VSAIPFSRGAVAVKIRASSVGRRSLFVAVGHAADAIGG
jgi:hypothetical protein